MKKNWEKSQRGPRFFPIFFHFFVVFDVFFLKVKFFLKSNARLLRYSHSKKKKIFFRKPISQEPIIQFQKFFHFRKVNISFYHLLKGFQNPSSGSRDIAPQSQTLPKKP